jgi:ureidoacrylate peracid hydrolase
MRLDTHRTALLVVDMQNAFCHPEGSLAKLGKDVSMCVAAVAPCRRLVDTAHAANVPVIYTRIVYRRDYRDRGIIPHEKRPMLKDVATCVAGTWDAALVDEFVPRPEDFVLDKNRPSAFFNAPTDTYLRNLGIETLVVCGVTTSMCVESTVRDAGQMDYRTFVVRDATGELTKERHDASLVSMDYSFAHLVNTADVLKAWAPVAKQEVTR